MPTLKERMVKQTTRRFNEPTQIDSNTPHLQFDTLLTGFAVGFRANTYVMEQFLPELMVRKDSAKFRVYSPRGYFKGAPKRAETAIPQDSALIYDEDTYSADEYALKGWVSDDCVRNAMDDISPFSDETEYLTEKVLLTQELLTVNEIQVALKAAGAAYYTSLDNATRWNGGASANVLGDMSTAIKAGILHTGRTFNKMAMDTATYEAVINNSTVVDILKRMSSGVVTDSMPVASLRGLQITKADAVVNIGTEDAPDYANVLYDVDAVEPMKQTVIFGYVNTADKLSLGRTFIPKIFRVYKGRGLEGDLRQASVVSVCKKLAPKVTCVGAGYMIGNVLGA